MSFGSGIFGSEGRWNRNDIERTSHLIGLATFNRILSSLPRYDYNAKESYQPATLTPYCVYIESMRSTRYLVLITATHPTTFGYRGGNNAIVISKVSGVIHPVIRVRSTCRYVRNKWFLQRNKQIVKILDNSREITMLSRKCRQSKHNLLCALRCKSSKVYPFDWIQD